jgi:hypothetical protein
MGATALDQHGDDVGGCGRAALIAEAIESPLVTRRLSGAEIEEKFHEFQVASR